MIIAVNADGELIVAAEPRAAGTALELIGGALESAGKSAGVEIDLPSFGDVERAATEAADRVNLAMDKSGRVITGISVAEDGSITISSKLRGT